jgi:hypothetical protein
MEPLPKIINSCSLFLGIETSFFAVLEFPLKFYDMILRKAQIS